ncbi:MAG: DUF58 domain-containing protein [Opitutales bacterium]|nr:DUF58 domain-containing protein [Opitutales bacterium]
MISRKTEESEKTREILRRVHQVELKINRLVNDSLAGEYHSAFKGQGMNFDEVREYHSGDEVRNIDWNVTARTGKPFVKQFVEERELTIMLMIDVSASGWFGSCEETKRDLAAELGSMFAFSAIRNQDKVGLILFSDEVEHYIPPGKGNNHVLRVIRDILFFKPKGKKTNVSKALDYVNQILHRKAIVLLLSDFWLNEPYEENLERMIRKMDITNRKHDLISLSVTDPLEKQLPSCGLLAIEDIETGEQAYIDTRDRKTLEAFNRMSEEHSDRLRTLLRKKKIDQLELETGKPYIKEVHKFFKLRSKRRG